MRFLPTRTLGSLLLITSVSSCGMLSKDKDKGSSGITKEQGKGCIQGLVTNGITGERLGIKDSGTDGVFLLVRNKQLRAKYFVNREDPSNKNLLGEYYLCGFPLDESFPLLVVQNGYQTYEARVKVVSTIAQRTPNSQQLDITREYPTLLADIELYPVGVKAKDLKVVVYSKGDVVDGARVQLYPTTEHLMRGRVSQGTIQSQSGDVYERVVTQMRADPLIAETNKRGEAEFSGEELALGLGYNVVVFPPNSESRVLTADKKVFVGLRGQGTNLNSQPYEVSVSLDVALEQPHVVATSLDGVGYDEDGKLALHFDQPVELTNSSVDTIEATAVSGGSLPDGRTSVRVEVKGNSIYLTPIWTVVPNPRTERSARVVYSGLVVRPVGTTVNKVSYAVPTELLTVPIFDNM